MLKDDAIPEMIFNFSQFLTEIENLLLKFTEVKMVFQPDECICLYVIKFNSNFSDVFMSLKVFINKSSETRIEKLEEKDSFWSTTIKNQTSITDLEEIFSNHFNVIENEEMIEEDFEPEFLEEPPDVIEALETYEEETVKQPNKEDLKCENCLITMKTKLGLEQHQKRSCQTPKILIDKTKNPPKVKQDKKKKNCPFCNVLILSESLSRHIKSIHLNLKPHACSICGKKFATASLKSAHEKTHGRNSDLQQYLVTESDKVYYQCPNCNGAKFEKSDQLKNHMMKNCYCPSKKRAYSYSCKFCLDIKFNTKILAAKHYQEVHNFQIKNIKKFCFICNDEFDDYINHIRQHTCLYACKYCSTKFLTEAKCKAHEEKHENEEIERPYGCMEEECGASFKSHHHLKSHTLAMHRSGGIERKFTCELCGDKFLSKALLNAHLRTHESDSIFVCKFCDKRFKKLSNLKIHSIAIHQTDAIYVCSDCSSRFKFLNDLKVHSLKEHGKRLNTQKYFHEVD